MFNVNNNNSERENVIDKTEAWPLRNFLQISLPILSKFKRSN